ncbi:MAG: hypothetical protein JWR02_1732 [Mucilaginibacter sp.]|nr:hypothetical protein [Mucilaginibacter sp.]
MVEEMSIAFKLHAFNHPYQSRPKKIKKLWK